MNYDEQYCEIHKQHYGSHLNECPICVGEKIGKDKTKQNEKNNKHGTNTIIS